MYKTINKFEFFILLEPYIDQIEIFSPLLDFIKEVPTEEWDTQDIEIQKEILFAKLDETDLSIFKDIVQILVAPEYAYVLSWQLNTSYYINKLYEKNGKITKLIFNPEGLFTIEPPVAHKEKILRYTSLIDISNYQMDDFPVHLLSYPEYVILNMAFGLEEASQFIGEDENNEFTHFTITDLEEDFQDKDYDFIKDMLPFFQNNTTDLRSIDIPNTVQSLIDKGYLKTITENNLSLGNKAQTLFEKLYKWNKSYFSVFATRYKENKYNAEKYTMFQYTKECCCTLVFKDGLIQIQFLSGRDTLQEALLQSFTFQ